MVLDPGFMLKLTCTPEFEMLHDDEVIPKYAADIVIGRVQGQQPRLEY